MAIPVEDIKDSVDLVSYIEEFYPEIILKKTGKVYTCICPFHDEVSPSFTIWSDNNTFKCFGCEDVYGDIFTFVGLMEGLDLQDDFRDICKIIAKNIGFTYKDSKGPDKHLEFKKKMDSHSRRYWYALRENQEAMSYLNNRGITAESINSFRIGFVPEDEYKTRTDFGNIAGRLAFPILEHKLEKNARCIAMGYRTLKGEKPKYLNDPNREGIFTKGEVLYGFPQARQEIRKQNLAYIVEGYMDTVAMHQAGFKNTVAPLGTALTDSQLDILLRLTKNLVLFLDGDGPGMANMIRILPTVIEKGFNVYIITKENGKDAADVCFKYKYNKDAIEGYIENYKSLALKFYIDREFLALENYIFQEKLRLAKKINPLLETIPDDFEKMLYQSILKDKIK